MEGMAGEASVEGDIRTKAKTRRGNVYFWVVSPP